MATVAEGKSSPSSALAAAVDEWISWDFTPAKEQVQKLRDAGRWEELGKMFQPRIAFGTAGLRSRMAPGYACMNELVVVQASQGLCSYVLEHVENAQKRGLVVGFDGRHNSRTFAELTAATFISKGFRVALFQKMVCTPFVPYAVRKLGFAAGVMVTASHNPKDDNGYKVYWSNGAQIIPPHDAGIAAAIDANRRPWAPSPALDKASPLLSDPYDDVFEKYFADMAQYSWSRADNPHTKLRVTYTAMHGVGAPFARRAFEVFNLPEFVPTPAQMDANPDFPTVKFPNPEEGKGALALAMGAAEAADSPIIIANDPDADRMAAAERAGGEWRMLNGNEIAILFADWVWMNWQRTHPTGDKSKCVMLSSTVSSQIIKAMAEKEGFQFIGTLTGFKWMGNAADDAIKRGLAPLFAFEVEIGFLVGDMSLDKDGVRVAPIFYELASHWYKQGLTLAQRLDQLYKKYGYFWMNTSYFFCDSANIAKCFARFRTENKGTYPDTIGDYKVSSVRDVTLGTDSAAADGKGELPATPDAQMVTFRFENGATATLRASGTEPKLKYYVEVSSTEGMDAARALADDMTAQIIREVLRPDEFQMVAPKKD